MSTRAQLIDEVCQLALTQVSDHVPYKFAGQTPDEGFDCSGLVRYCYGTVTGLWLPHSAFQQYKLTRRIFARGGRPRKGDLVFYYKPVDHVAIYLGDGYIVQAGDPQLGLQRVHTKAYAKPVFWGRVDLSHEVARARDGAAKKLS